MNKFLLLALAMTVQFASFSAMASSLCDSEYTALLAKLQNYDGGERQKRQLISEYHNRKSSLAATCSYEQVSAVDKAFAKVTRQQALYSTFRPRKTVEIATIQIRRPASR